MPAANGRLDTESAPGTTEERLNALSAALSLLPEPGLPSRATVASTRRFLVTHHVDEVVVSDRGRNPQFARRWYTSVLGVSPVRQADVWVWPDVARDLR